MALDRTIATFGCWLRGRRRQPSMTARFSSAAWGLVGAVLGALLALGATRFDRRRRKELADQRGHLAASLPRTLSAVRRDAGNRIRGLVARASRSLDRSPMLEAGKTTTQSREVTSETLGAVS